MEIKLLETAGWKSVLSALRLPYKKEVRSEIIEEGENEFLLSSSKYHILIDPKDLLLLKTLKERGDEHAKILRGLLVYLEVVAPLYFWSECDTYRIGRERLSSESTMHTILNEELTINNFVIEDDEDKEEIEKFIFLVQEYKKKWFLQKLFLKRKIKKRLPTSFLQKRIDYYSYQCLSRMYRQRKQHELMEWQEFCKFIEQLPFAKELIIGE